MGKTGDAEQAVLSPAPAVGAGSAIAKALDAKCLLMLFLCTGAFLSALFMLLRLHASGTIADDPGILPGEIQASFFLLKPRSQLASHAKKLEEDIYGEVGVPDSKVSVSMHTSKYRDTTYVTFGILPDTTNTPISEQSITALRTTLIQLTLEQLNLSLPSSVFGDTFCLEILGFPGGITVPPLSNGTTVYATALFSVTLLNRTIHQIKVLLQQLKILLRLILELTPDEDLIVLITNDHGSTINPPVTVNISVAPDDPSRHLQPYRLKQLAQIITKIIPNNLDLDPSIFGITEDLKLSPYLQGFIPSYAPESAPAPSFRSNTPFPQSSTTNPNGSFSCPTLERRTGAYMHRKLMTISSTLVTPRIPTRFDSGSVYRSRKNSASLAEPMLIAPASQPK